MKQLLPLICLLLATCMESVEAQQHIDLSGKWHFGTGAKATYDGFVSLPGSEVLTVREQSTLGIIFHRETLLQRLQ